MTRLLFGILLTTSTAFSQHLQPPAVTTSPDTNLYYLNFTWDTVTNASSYAVMAWSNGAVQQVVMCTTNYVAVSNLPPTLDSFVFKSQSINDAGISDASSPAPLNLAYLYTSDDLTNWMLAPSVVYDPKTNASRFLRLSNWNYKPYLRRQ